ncbi:MAG: hypothetical protein HYX86_03160 [Chloroflexi bacterium]|nr:hypothetical protein [Chloroflexota bacterium]
MEVKVVLDKARAALARGEQGKAVAQAREILKESPRDLEARIFLGARLLEVGDWMGAREQFEVALRVDPVNSAALLGTGEALFYLGDKIASRQAIERAIALYPEEEGARALLRTLHGEKAYLFPMEEAKSQDVGPDLAPRLTDSYGDFADSDDREEEEDEELGEDEEDEGQYADEPWVEFLSTASAIPEPHQEAGPISPAKGEPVILEDASGVVMVEEGPEEESPGKPVEVILSSRNRLREKYGEEGWRRINGKVQDLAQAIPATEGMDSLVVYVDDPAILVGYGLEPVDTPDPIAIHNFLASLSRALASRGQKLSFLLVLGGDDIIPLFRLPNPTEDPDNEILTDAPYAGGKNYFLPQRAVGRMPDGNSSDPTLLLTLIDSSIAAHRQKRRRLGWLHRLLLRNGKSLGLTAQIWKEASAQVFSNIGSPKRMEVSPPASDFEFLERHRELPGLAYFNLHGLEDSPYWYGHEVKGQEEEFPIAITPQNMFWAGAPSSVIYSESCYGAKFVGYKVEEALALSFLAAGARAVIGSTAMSYGALRPPLSGADLLGMNLWRGLAKGYAVGEALRRAKLGLVEEMGKRQGFLDGEDQKTVLSFILLGDPSLPAPAFTSRKLRGEDGKSVFCPSVVCGHSSRKMDKFPVSKEVVGKVQKELRKKMPFVGQVGFQVRPQVLCNGECGCTGQGNGSKGAETPHMLAQSLVFSTHREIRLWGDKQLKQVVRVTTDPAGKVLKLAISK